MTAESIIDIEIQGAELSAYDIAGNAFTVDLVGWDRLDEGPAAHRNVDETVVGRVSELRFEVTNYAGFERLDDDLDLDLADEGASHYTDFDVAARDDVDFELPDGRYLLRVGESLVVFLWFENAARIRHQPYGDLTVSFPHPVPVRLGFQSTVEHPRGEITVEPTPEGVATGLSHLSASLQTIGPDRAHHSFRNHPPLLVVGEETVVPDDIAAAVPDTGLELVVPARFEALFPITSLAFYLGANVRVESGATPRLTSDSGSLHHEFDPMPHLQFQAAEILSRTFLLDYLVRWPAPDDPKLEQHRLVSDLDLDLERLAMASPVERLARYLELPDSFDDRLPEWRYWLYVDPTIENLPVLSMLTNNLARIYNPDAAGRVEREAPDPVTGEGEEWLRRSGFVRGTVGTSEGPGFEATVDSYEHRLKYLSEQQDRLSVTVGVVGEAAEAPGHLAAAYRQRDDLVAVDVEALVDPTCSKLARAIEAGPDVLHYVGKTDGESVSCADGVLDTASLQSNDVQAFVIDAPASEAAASRFVEQGSVTAVARGDTFDPSMGPLLTGAVEFFLSGKSVSQALALAQGYHDLPDVPRVIGDGALRTIGGWHPSPIDEFVTSDDGLRVTTHSFSIDPGGSYTTDQLDRFHLVFSEGTTDVSAQGIASSIDDAEWAISHDDRLYWPETSYRLVYPLA